jgi:hypothetical protein
VPQFGLEISYQIGPAGVFAMNIKRLAIGLTAIICLSGCVVAPAPAPYYAPSPYYGYGYGPGYLAGPSIVVGGGWGWHHRHWYR